MACIKVFLWLAMPLQKGHLHRCVHFINVETFCSVCCMLGHQSNSVWKEIFWCSELSSVNLSCTSTEFRWLRMITEITLVLLKTYWLTVRCLVTYKSSRVPGKQHQSSVLYKTQGNKRSRHKIPLTFCYFWCLILVHICGHSHNIQSSAVLSWTE